jgi:hypothetical protein
VPPCVVADRAWWASVPSRPVPPPAPCRSESLLIRLGSKLLLLPLCVARAGHCSRLVHVRCTPRVVVGGSGSLGVW